MIYESITKKRWHHKKMINKIFASKITREILQKKRGSQSKKTFMNFILLDNTFIQSNFDL